MIAFALAADSKGLVSWGRMDFFLFVTVTSWLLVIAVFLLFAFNVISVINVNIDWNLPVRVSYYEKHFMVQYSEYSASITHLQALCLVLLSSTFLPIANTTCSRHLGIIQSSMVLCHFKFARQDPPFAPKALNNFSHYIFEIGN